MMQLWEWSGLKKWSETLDVGAKTVVAVFAEAAVVTVAAEERAGVAGAVPVVAAATVVGSPTMPVDETTAGWMR